MPVPFEYKLAVGVVLAAGAGLYLWGKRREARVVAEAAAPPGVRPPDTPTGPTLSAWDSPPPSAFLTAGAVTRTLTNWEKSVLSAYYRPELLGVAVLHLGQWGQWRGGAPAPEGAVAATLDRDIYFKDPNVLFTSPTSMSTLAHELFHVAEYATGMTHEQYREGKAAAQAGHPETNPFEAPAYAMGQQVFMDLIGSHAVSGYGVLSSRNFLPAAVSRRCGCAC
jgi:hypothetical protein